MLALAISLLVFAAVSLLVVSVRRQPSNPVQSRLAAIRNQVAGPPSGVDMSAPFSNRVIAPILDGLADRISAMLPPGIIAKVRRGLIAAGQPVTLSSFLTVWMVLSIGLPAVIIAANVLGGNQWGLQEGLMVVLVAAIGILLPVMWLRIKVQRRQKQIVKSLPDSLDLITACVEAGLGLDAALGRVAQKIKGPLSEELLIALREMAMGRLRREALHDMAERTGVPDLAMFIRALIQAEQMGISIGQVLRVQAEQMRVRRRQRAEQAAYQAPVKMLFPLVLFIFPSMLVVILGPALIRITEFLGEAL